MNFIISLLIIFTIPISALMAGQNGILDRANEAKVQNQTATVSEQVQMAVFTETSHYLQNNVLSSNESGAEELANAIKNAVNNPSSELVKSLPSGYTVSNPVMISATQVTFNVTVDGSIYTATYDGNSQETTVN